MAVQGTGHHCRGLHGRSGGGKSNGRSTGQRGAEYRRCGKMGNRRGRYGTSVKIHQRSGIRCSTDLQRFGGRLPGGRRVCEAAVRGSHPSPAWTDGAVPGETHRTDRRSGIPGAEEENAPCRRCPEKAGENGGKTGRAGEDKRRDIQTEGTGSGKGTCGQRALRPKEDHRDKKQSGDNRRRHTEESRTVRGAWIEADGTAVTCESIRGRKRQCWQSNRQTGAADGRK